MEETSHGTPRGHGNEEMLSRGGIRGMALIVIAHVQRSMGKPEPSFGRGLKGLKKDQPIPVPPRRCPKWGYLKSYAVKQPTPDPQSSATRRRLFPSLFLAAT